MLANTDLKTYLWKKKKKSALCPAKLELAVGRNRSCVLILILRWWNKSFQLECGWTQCLSWPVQAHQTTSASCNLLEVVTAHLGQIRENMTKNYPEITTFVNLSLFMHTVIDSAQTMEEKMMNKKEETEERHAFDITSELGHRNLTSLRFIWDILTYWRWLFFKTSLVRLRYGYSILSRVKNHFVFVAKHRHKRLKG